MTLAAFSTWPGTPRGPQARSPAEAGTTGWCPPGCASASPRNPRTFKTSLRWLGWTCSERKGLKGRRGFVGWLVGWLVGWVGGWVGWCVLFGWFIIDTLLAANVLTSTFEQWRAASKTTITYLTSTWFHTTCIRPMLTRKDVATSTQN